MGAERSELAIAETEYVGSEDVRFGFRRLGPRGGRPLLMCQRFRGTIDDWDPAFVDLLATERDVIAFDNLGVGYSSGLVPAAPAEMADATVTFADLLEIESFDLLGWSMGGFVAQAVALRAPGRVRRLIVAASKPGHVPDTAQTSPEASRIAGKPVNDEEDFLYLFFPHTPAGREVGSGSLHRLNTGRPGSRAGVSAVGARAQTEALISWSSGGDTAWERLNELNLPVLVGHGTHDLLMDPLNAYAMTARLPDAKLVLYSDAGHAFLFQHAHDFGREVLGFLR